MFKSSERSSAMWCFLIIIGITTQLSVAGQNGIEFLGNEIILRPGFMSRDGQHSFVDTNVNLTRGTLKAFRFYIHNLADDTSMSDVTAQIWRPITGEDVAFRLVWEKNIVPEKKNEEFTVHLDKNEEFELKSQDKLGFQCSSNTCPVSMDIDPRGKTYIRGAQNNIRGKVLYDFKGPIATVFSMGVDILPLRSFVETTADITDTSMAEEELLHSTGKESSDNLDRQTSGVPQEDIQVNLEEEDESTEEFSDEDVEALDEPEYTKEEREEMLGQSVYRGNNLTLEDEFWLKEGRKTFIDTTFQLRKGTLKAVSLFVHDGALDIEKADLYLELWTRTKVETTNFKLEWQRKVNLDKGTNRLYEFILSPSDRVAVTNQHMLGFTNLHHSCPITFKYAEEGRTLFRTIKKYEGPPFLNHVYHFAEVHEPILYSMGAHVTPNGEPTDDLEENQIPVKRPVRRGHSLQKRQYMLPNSPIHRAFVDKSVELTPGYVTKFLAYIGGLPSRELRLPLRFQVWTYSGTSGEGVETHPIYKLKWQQIFTLSSLTLTTSGHRKEEFVVTEPVQVDENDRIGFVSEANTIQIPYDFNNPLGPLPSQVNLVDVLPLNRTEDGSAIYPAVGEQIYHFESHPHPITWSIEVEIQPTEDGR